MQDDSKTADANPSHLWAALQEVGAELEPYLKQATPPSWAVSLSFVLEVATKAVEELCQEDISDDA